ncbi:MAG: hypothetical protein PUF12_04535 [Thermoflexaceae bacterium]|nr:hypothetical protein [Thermoflexaceae bacterium]
MKKAKLMVFLMYMHLLASIVLPAMAVIYANKYDAKTGWLVILTYIILVLVIQIYGWICTVNAKKLVNQDKLYELKEIWLLLKLKTIPFYIINYIYSFLVWFVIVAASRGIFIIFVWIPVAVTCSFIIQSGLCGYYYLKAVCDIQGISITNNQMNMQFIPVLDFFGTLKLRKMLNDI